ncbi:ABC transporter permease [Krasilnikoviella flava]|uniref:Putative ABC transport system permease protein n=1 Tax=Krasilnikoviella flava TaxID=526729 RepID=A0A1T5IFG2_9MICO|nr:ABC transporter permease [Krasilnikoviella flava]SKC37855.1 putative ABC transport system permease protein [Krasilnikoviella flava]
MSGPVARWRGRWRVALRYGWRDARRHRGRTTLVAIMVALPVAAGSFATTALWSARDTPETVAQRELGPDFQAALSVTGIPMSQTPDATSHGGTGGAVIGPRPVAAVEADLAAELPDGDRLVRFLRTQDAGFDVHAGGLQLSTPAVLQGDLTDPDVRRAFRLREGALPSEGEVALSASKARELDVTVGDRVTLARAEDDELPATVSGLLDDPAPQQTDLLFPAAGPLALPATAPGEDGYDDADGPLWFVAGDVPVTWDDVLALNELGAVVVSRDVLFSPPPVEAVEFYDGRPPESTSDQLQQWAPLAAVVAVALLEVVLLIGPAFAVGARRSARSLALIAAAGGTRRSLRAVVLGTGVVIGVGASAAGTLVGVGAAAFVVVRWTDAALAVPWAPITSIFAVGVVLATGAAWLPARRASRADVVAVLAGRRGETSYRRWPVVVGTALGVVGFAGALAAGLAGQAMGVAAGVVVGELGLVFACGGIVAALGRLARHLPLTWRFALRDAARHRGRTAPALAAVLVAVAGASGGLVYSSSQTAHDQRSQAPVAAPDVLVIGAADPETDSQLTREQGDRVQDVVHDVLPDVGRLYPVTVLRGPYDGSTATSVGVAASGSPEGGYHELTTGIVGPVVDDGTLVPLLGLPSPDVAAAALAAGRAVVLAGTEDDDGTAALDVVTWDTDAQEPTGHRSVRVPATGVGDPLGPSNANFPVVPASAAQATGTSPALGGFVAMPGTPPGEAERQTLQAALDEEFPGTDVGSCTVCVSVGADPQPYGSPQWLSTLLILGSAGILALAAAWIVAALAATESRPDLATLAAVGAAPTTRKRIVAAQAGTVAVIGSVLGGASGVALGAAFVLFERFRYAEPDPRWTVEVPWPVLGATLVVLPSLAVTAAWLVTRSRLVLTRRLAS